jgi:uncharacterized protein (DUF1330 family)
MPAYVVYDVEVSDPEAYSRTSAQARESIEKYGGIPLVRGGHVETLEGDWRPDRFIIIQFECLERARAWYNSPELAAGKTSRQSVSRARTILVEGL